MGSDLCLGCDNGLVNIRVGAIIIKDNKVLMVGNDRVDYLYSVGGRIKFGETTEEAVIREVFEETGVKMQVDRLGFVHENLFCGDGIFKNGKLVYELSYFFYMKVPEDFCIQSQSFTEDNVKERLCWISLDEIENYPKLYPKLYPKFFKTELKNPSNSVKYFLTDER